MRYIKTFESFSVNEEEGSFRKFFTGHESSEARDKAMMDFMKALDEAEARVSEDPSDYVFNREFIENKAKEDNYKGGIRVQRGGGRDKRFYVVYDPGATGFEDLASAAGGAVSVFRPGSRQ
jgi:hypothetical protein